MSDTFFCIDAHTCGNPVRMVAGGAPLLQGNSMLEKRKFFLENFDWVRRSLMFEPRGHDAMSGSILYPPTRPDCDIAILFIEVSGCLPMCGHGTIGTVTAALEHGLVRPKTPGLLKLDTPAGLVEAKYEMKDGRVESVKLTNVPSFLHSTGLSVEVPGLGEIFFDVAYGGNFYAIVEPQRHFFGTSSLSVGDIQRYSPQLRTLANEKYKFTHPEQPEIKGLSHVMWTGKPTVEGATAKNAVFYGDKGIDRSPCGTGTSARMAQLAARGDLRQGDVFVHESIIGTLFKGTIEGTAKVGGIDAIIPGVEGWARVFGHNTITVDKHDPLWEGFLLP
ncbi:4-hydroxyproline epimerase [Herbaspirillum sp. RV1423]|uniref:4-hydroxyproline epimerase n=1 Tax=Herbaspirillum sp. RV1423 TaxID=1443993 RepID=UPI0004BA3DD1|nr:4-hydroxyproline epimerase [Herbaspirillum sp. RV1423]